MCPKFQSTLNPFQFNINLIEYREESSSYLYFGRMKGLENKSHWCQVTATRMLG